MLLSPLGMVPPWVLGRAAFLSRMAADRIGSPYMPLGLVPTPWSFAALSIGYRLGLVWSLTSAALWIATGGRFCQ